MGTYVYIYFEKSKYLISKNWRKEELYDYEYCKK